MRDSKKILAFCGLVICLLTGFAAFAQTEPDEETLIFLVRHAEKDLTESSADPPLSAQGKARADKLATLLKDAGIQAVYSTATKRTEQTTQPLLQKLGLTIRHYNAAEDGLAAKLVTQSKGKRVLVVSHSNIVPDLLNEYTRSKKYTHSEEYGDLFVIRIIPQKSASVLHLHF